MTVGSLVDAPKDLLKEIKVLEELFTVDTAKLKQITDHFVNELTKGKHASGFQSEWPSNPTANRVHQD
jgi:hexokinase